MARTGAVAEALAAGSAGRPPLRCALRATGCRDEPPQPAAHPGQVGAPAAAAPSSRRGPAPRSRRTALALRRDRRHRHDLVARDGAPPRASRRRTSAGRAATRRRGGAGRTRGRRPAGPRRRRGAARARAVRPSASASTTTSSPSRIADRAATRTAGRPARAGRRDVDAVRVDDPDLAAARPAPPGRRTRAPAARPTTARTGGPPSRTAPGSGPAASAAGPGSSGRRSAVASSGRASWSAIVADDGTPGPG